MYFPQFLRSNSRLFVLPCKLQEEDVLASVAVHVAAQSGREEDAVWIHLTASL